MSPALSRCLCDSEHPFYSSQTDIIEHHAKGPAMLSTRFTDLVGCTLPIQQAGMGGLASPRLASAVANAGGLGTVSVYGLSSEIVTRALDEAREHTPGVIGANIILRFVEPA